MAQGSARYRRKAYPRSRLVVLPCRGGAAVVRHTASSRVIATTWGHDTLGNTRRVASPITPIKAARSRTCVRRLNPVWVLTQPGQPTFDIAVICVRREL